MASIETLPAPLPLAIIKYLPDLKSLYAIRLSSPTFAAALNLHAVELLEHIMHKNLPQDVIIELRVYTLLLSRKSTVPPSTEELEALYITAYDTLPQNVPAHIVNHTLNLFAKLSSTCNAIFHDKLDRLYHLPHEHLADKQWGRWSKIRKNYGIPYTLPPPSPPEWEERQRLLRAALRVKIWHMSTSSDPLLQDFPAICRFRFGCRRYLKDEFFEMSDSMSSHEHELITWEPPSFFTSEELPQNIRKLERDCLYRKKPGLADLGSVITTQPLGYDYFHSVCVQRNYSPMKDADWNILRSLGLGIWSDRRLVEMGLRDPAHPLPPCRMNVPVQPRPIKTSVMTYNDVLWTWNALYRAAVANNLP